MSDWEPITRGEVSVPDSQPTPGLITAETNLSTSPDADWANAFRQPSGVSFTLSMRPPRLLGSKVTIEVFKAEELPAMVAYVDGAIGWANQWYETQVLPRLRAEAARRDEARQARDAETQKARDIAKGL